MNDLVKQTYRIMARNGFKIKKEHLWVVNKSYTNGSFYFFKSLDGKIYALTINPTRPKSQHHVAIPYELFVGDEHV